jgi:hypothetical protein
MEKNCSVENHAYGILKYDHCQRCGVSCIEDKSFRNGHGKPALKAKKKSGDDQF